MLFSVARSMANDDLICMYDDLICEELLLTCLH